MNKKELYKKLEKCIRVCSDCWDKYWERPEWHLGTFHNAICDVCWEEKSCTEPRDFLYFNKTLRWKHL